MSKLIILRGNSGSGKSTTAIRLRRELGYGTMLIPQDMIRREIVRVKDEVGNPSIQLMKDIANYGLKIGYDVVIEGILVRATYGEMLYEVAKLFDEVYIYYFDIPLEETFRRHKTKPNAHEFGEELMRELYVARDLLGLPGEVIFTEDQSQDEVLERILRDIRGK